MKASPHEISVDTKLKSSSKLHSYGSIPQSSHSLALSIPQSIEDCINEEPRPDYTTEELQQTKIYVKHCWEIFTLSVPVTIGYVIEFLVPFISTYTVAWLLASSALSAMFANVTGWSIVFGMTTSLDTLCSQAYSGASDVRMVGIYLQRGCLTTLAILVPVSVLWWHTEPLLLLIGQDPELSHLCSIYLRWLLLALPPFVVFECVKKFLQAQGIMEASTKILFLSLPVCISANYLLVHHPSTSIGFVGAPIASAITEWFCAISIITYVLFIDGKQAWGGFSPKAFEDWGTIIKLGVPGVIQICSEWWAYELMAFGASYLSIEALAAHSVVTNISGIFYQVALGVGVVASNLTGNALGEGRPNQAKLSAICCLIVVLLFGLMCASIVTIFTPFWSTMFNDQPEIVEIVCSLLPILAVFQIGEAVSGLSNGVLRGIGRQSLGAKINTAVFYIFAVPLGFFLAFELQLGIQGFWLGMCSALWAISVIGIYIIFTVDWHKEAMKAQQRVGSETMID